MNVRLKTSRNPSDVTAFVTTDHGEVRVRFRRSDTRPQWRCDHCGTHRFSTCPHELAAARAIREGTTP